MTISEQKIYVIFVTDSFNYLGNDFRGFPRQDTIDYDDQYLDQKKFQISLKICLLPRKSLTFVRRSLN